MLSRITRTHIDACVVYSTYYFIYIPRPFCIQQSAEKALVGCNEKEKQQQQHKTRKELTFTLFRCSHTSIHPYCIYTTETTPPPSPPSPTTTKMCVTEFTVVMATSWNVGLWSFRPINFRAFALFFYWLRECYSMATTKETRLFTFRIRII